ncbi:hypothetical protein [Sphingobium sp. D43FB]|uniref:hypothetical protein n=1 Tax=Sphingobium sp. D43FB TaxID=2017595 RepID=UPI000BB56053|nr:hypothetical protein [Sphingobium sp. D43FB]PBN45066.1 hypothetical protein SxD43FB_02430 [Sphingobium sp. D43FB]
MFSWFRKKPKPLQPEGKWVVAIEDDQISVRNESGRLKSVAKSDLSGVAIETNDSGPWGADVWWMLFDATDQMACTFPQGAKGEDAAINWLTALPSFNHGEMIRAMGSTNNAVFAVWRKEL